MALPEDYQKKIVEVLNKKKANANCEICNSNNWAIADQAVTLLVSKLEGGISLPPPNIPCAVVVCNNCGNVRLFALNALGILDKNQGGEK